MKRVLFSIQVDSVVDVITNSSSELFVLNGKSKSIVSEMIRSIYPNYLDEYEEVKKIDELSNDELNQYFEYICCAEDYPTDSKDEYYVPEGFTFNELYEPQRDSKGNIEPPAYNGQIQYTLKVNGYVTPSNREYIINKLSPKKNMYFLYSKDENPDWEYQQALSQIADRYHLG